MGDVTKLPGAEREMTFAEHNRPLVKMLRIMLATIMKRAMEDGDYTFDGVKKMAEALESIVATEVMLADGDAPDFARGRFNIKQDFDAADSGRGAPKGPDGK